MKNPEEDILKRFLQDTFSDYEPEPSDVSWENIRKEIQPQQPNVGAGFRQLVVPVVALLLLIGGIVWNQKDTGDNTEIAMNSLKENSKNASQEIDYQSVNSRKSLKQNVAIVNHENEKIFVNKTASKGESMVLPKVEKSLEVLTFSTISNPPIAKQDIQEYSVSTKEFVGIDDKLPVVSSLGNSLDKNVVVSVFTDNGLRKVISEDTDNNVESLNKQVVVGVLADKSVSLGDPVIIYNNDNKDTDNNDSKVLVVSNIQNQSIEKGFVTLEKKRIKDIPQAIAQIEESKTNNLENIVKNTALNDAIIQEVRYIKPLEMLKNKDFVLVKNELSLPKISEISINREAKPVRRPVYMSMSVTPLQTYRILTVNNQNIQNLQTNNLFDSERNGLAFDLGITKAIGEKWNLRSSISYLKMRQWAEYQVNTENIAVRNSNNYSNSVSIGNADNEFIGQTRIESKTLQMVGLKADVQRFFKITGRNRYFISGGSQLMIEPAEKQTNVFLNASAGFQHLVNKDCFLTIEPTASYLLNNINDSKSLIQTNAYNLGLKVGFNFRVK